MFTLRVHFIDPNLPTIKHDHKHACKDLKEAQAFWTTVREFYNLGASHMEEGCGDVFVGDTRTHRISYNGRVWDAQDREVIL